MQKNSIDSSFYYFRKSNKSMHVKAAEDSLPCKYVLFLHVGRAFAFYIDRKEKNTAAGPLRKAMGRLQAAMQASVGKQVPR